MGSFAAGEERLPDLRPSLLESGAGQEDLVYHELDIRGAWSFLVGSFVVVDQIAGKCLRHVPLARIQQVLFFNLVPATRRQLLGAE